MPPSIILSSVAVEVTATSSLILGEVSVLLVSVSVVAFPTRVSVAAGRVRVMLPENAECAGQTGARGGHTRPQGGRGGIQSRAGGDAGGETAAGAEGAADDVLAEIFSRMCAPRLAPFLVC